MLRSCLTYEGLRKKIFKKKKKTKQSWIFDHIWVVPITLTIIVIYDTLDKKIENKNDFLLYLKVYCYFFKVYPLYVLTFQSMQLNKQEVSKLKNVAPVNCYAAGGKFG